MTSPFRSLSKAYLPLLSRSLCCLLLLAACTSRNTAGPGGVGTDSTTTTVQDTTITAIPKDSLILQQSRRILRLLQQQDDAGLAEHFHPVRGVRFSPYGNIDTASDVVLSRQEFLQRVQKSPQDSLHWGSYDGSGDSILLTPAQYFRKFVYNADFLNAEKTSLNKPIGHGNSLNNLEQVYKGCDYTESYFSGFDKKYEGMDWTCLRLVYAWHEGKPYLVGIVHDQWTI